jgi:LmeA-like phospholipid-binding
MRKAPIWTFTILLSLLWSSLAPSAKAQWVAPLITPLLKAWVMQQVTKADNLDIKLQGTDQELLRGLIPQINISADNVVYQGIQAHSVNLVGRSVQLDLSQALRGGGGVKLKSPVQADLAITMAEPDLNRYLTSPQFQKQFANLRLPMAGSGGSASSVPLSLSQPQLSFLEQGRVQVAAALKPEQGPSLPVQITTGLDLLNSNTLKLNNPELKSSGQLLPTELLQNLKIDLGKDTQVKSLDIRKGLMQLSGIFTIRP